MQTKNLVDLARNLRLHIFLMIRASKFNLWIEDISLKFLSTLISQTQEKSDLFFILISELTSAINNTQKSRDTSSSCTLCVISNFSFTKHIYNTFNVRSHFFNCTTDDISIIKTTLCFPKLNANLLHQCKGQRELFHFISNAFLLTIYFELPLTSF